MNMRTFGMIPSPLDARDVIFKVRSPFPDKYALMDIDAVTNQGQDPICASISIAGMVNWQKRVKTPERIIPLNPMDIYKLRSDPNMQGMIPRDALKAMKKKGVGSTTIKSYARVEDPDSARAALMINGPVMLCTMAYNEDNFWIPGDKSMGGHAVQLVGWDKSGFILQNSWGLDWGKSGMKTFPFSDWQYVLEAWTINI